MELSFDHKICSKKAKELENFICEKRKNNRKYTQCLHKGVVDDIQELKVFIFVRETREEPK